MCLETIFKFSSPAGWQICRQILKERLPFGPHDYQLDGVSAILDKQVFVGVSATGSGKSAYSYMVLHVIQGLQAQPRLCPSAKFPFDAAILMIYPTKALEEDQVSWLCSGVRVHEKGKGVPQADILKGSRSVYYKT
jgi:ATP-dependent helicase YprA (DUF1998 family)